MNRVFADTGFFLPISDRNDPAYESATTYFDTHAATLVTTTWVMLESANSLSRGRHRRETFLVLYDRLKSHPASTIIDDRDLLDAGLRLYRSRLDKNWSLTDCISFELMRSEKIAEALTTDHHFEQAGFIALLK